MGHALSVASEIAPLVKTGGLADVVGALPGALAGCGWQLRTLLPLYPSVKVAMGDAVAVAKFDDLFGGRAQVLVAEIAGLDLLLLDAPHLFDREGSIYLGRDGRDWPDNPMRFAALSYAAAKICADGVEGWRPKVAHLHDWQAGLTPVYLKALGAKCGSILTVHNIAFQGLAPARDLSKLKLPKSGFTRDGFEYWEKISALKAGLVGADRITTVSPTYAGELLEPEFGMGLEGVIRTRSNVLSGILNGIDTEIWNPATDNLITTYKTPRGKLRNKRALEAEFGLASGKGPIAVVVSRLTAQKGLDLLADALPAFLDHGGRLVLLGSGDADLETRWQEMAKHRNVAVKIGYDEALSHRIIAGGDAILVPSRFEPCGLTQLYGLRYGTVPVVAHTGGLVDSVIDASPVALKAGVATGIQHAPDNVDALVRALMRLLALYSNGKRFLQMQRNGMKSDLGWDGSAAEYARLYDEVAAN